MCSVYFCVSPRFSHNSSLHSSTYWDFCVRYSLNIELHLHSVLSHCHLPLYYLTLLTLSAPLPMTYVPVAGLSHFPLFGITFSSANPLKIKLPVFSSNLFPLCIPISVHVEFILLSLQRYSKSWPMFSVKGQIGNTSGVSGYVHSVTTPQLRETWIRIPSLPQTGCWIF